ncbi:hypothetical protein [Fructobacillus ficulneus]|uniref:Uncharacterized protein n=1 Tax=Fructobacillus ficulneus TaxID=157463 RepID=A0A0K8MIU6_9LACO|nr:hypothetical protein [Fructobacillus ficulneus]GAO99814.1 hypothetical protein FFIC_240890 [Fructobacillus ficulneus]
MKLPTLKEFEHSIAKLNQADLDNILNQLDEEIRKIDEDNDSESRFTLYFPRDSNISMLSGQLNNKTKFLLSKNTFYTQEKIEINNYDYFFENSYNFLNIKNLILRPINFRFESNQEVWNFEEGKVDDKTFVF